MIIAVILLSLFALFVLFAAALDLVPVVYTWVSRIGIGSLSQKEAEEKVKAVAVRWLRKTPAVPISDQTRFTLPERLHGTYKSKNVQSWQQAALLLGVAESGEQEAAKGFVDSLLSEGQWKNPIQSPDFALLAYAVLSAVEDKEALRPAMDSVYQFLAQDETVPYNRRNPDLRFVDTVGMVCPFFMLYAKTYDCPEAEALCMRQLQEYAAFGLHKELCLPVHCFKKSTGAPLGIYGWGRGCGWYALALTELMRLGVDVSEYAVPFAESLLKVQHNGAWSRQVLAEAGGESSATAMLGLFMHTMYVSANEEKYKQSAMEAVEFLRSATRKNGQVDYAQGDTKGVGFYSTKLTTLPSAQGFALRLLNVCKK